MAAAGSDTFERCVCVCVCGVYVCVLCVLCILCILCVCVLCLCCVNCVCVVCTVCMCVCVYCVWVSLCVYIVCVCILCLCVCCVCSYEEQHLVESHTTSGGVPGGELGSAEAVILVVLAVVLAGEAEVVWFSPGSCELNLPKRKESEWMSE